LAAGLGDGGRKTIELSSFVFRLPSFVLPNLTTAWGESAILLRWRIVQHLVLHGMQHHTEITQLLTAQGQSPSDIDFILYD
jgi:hypothetical protein